MKKISGVLGGSHSSVLSEIICFAFKVLRKFSRILSKMLFQSTLFCI